MFNQNHGTSLVHINLENFVVPAIGLGLTSAQLCTTLMPAQCKIHEDTNLFPKTILEKSTMKSSGILKEKINRK